MHTRESEQQGPAPTRSKTASTGVAPLPQQVLALQRSAGNAAVGRVLQRDVLDWLPSPLNPLGVVGELTGIRFPSIGSVTDPLAGPFEVAMQTNRAMADRISVPTRYREKLLEFARDNPLDGAMLVPALARSPRFYRGGWILDVQTGAKAMTLDNFVFVRGDLDINTYIHELVHVTQYGALGRTKFLMSYFGLSALTIAKRFVMREPLRMMESSPHEMQAYDLAARFDAWLAANP